MKTNEIATKEDIQGLSQELKEIKILLTGQNGEKTYSINELSKLGTIGKTTRIKSLISKGHIKTTADGKRIPDAEVKRYLNNQQT